MNWMAQHWLALVLLAGYTGALLYNAYLGSQASRGIAGYYVGNREMSGTVVGISFFATFASTNTYIGHAGKAYDYGFAWFTLAILLVLFSWISWRWIGPPLRRFASQWDALTLPDFLGSRYITDSATTTRHPLLQASGIVIVFASLLYLLAIFKGAGHLFQMFLSIPYEAGVGVTLVIVVLYTSVGGFVSVVRTDVLQGILMLLGSVVIFFSSPKRPVASHRLAPCGPSPKNNFSLSSTAASHLLCCWGFRCLALSSCSRIRVNCRDSMRSRTRRRYGAASGSQHLVWPSY